MLDLGRETYYNKKNHPFIIKKVYRENGNTYCEIEFLETGFITNIRKSVVDARTCKDRYAKDVCGVACIGNATKVDNLKEYTSWKNMIDRCYNPKNSHYKSYGGAGVYVCDRWLCFENYLNDLPSIEGYDKDLFNTGKIQLDKDKKQISAINKIYSIDTCIFLTRKENHSLRNLPDVYLKSVNVKCVAIHRDGERILVEHIPSFAKKNSLDAGKVYQCIKGIRKQHKGWRFEEWKN